MKVPVYSLNGESKEQLELKPELFAVKTVPAVIHQVITSHLSSARNTVASVKKRGEVRGGGRKPWRQKGTGRARAGSIRSPLWRGGGVVFGPTPERNFIRKVNRKQFRKSLFMVLSQKLADNRLFIFDKLELSEFSTKKVAEQISKLKAQAGISSKTLNIIIPKADEKLERSVANLPNVEVLRVSEITPYSLLKQEATVILKEALPVIEKTFARNISNK